MKRSVLAAILFLLFLLAVSAALAVSADNFNCICVGPPTAIASGSCSGFSASAGQRLIGVYPADLNAMLTPAGIAIGRSVGWYYNQSTGWMCGKSSY